MVFVLDNYDSFTYNLVQYIGELMETGVAKREEIVVRRNDELTPEEVLEMRPSRVLLSPGPCTPGEAGILVPLIQRLAKLPAEEQIPVLGVCLGYQAIGEAFGGDVVRAPKLMHGKTSVIEHDGEGVFQEMPNPMTCTRYHSLVVEETTLPDALEVTARVKDDGLMMGLRHKTLPIEGVQFHPESVLTEQGRRMIANFLNA